MMTPSRTRSSSKSGSLSKRARYTTTSKKKKYYTKNPVAIRLGKQPIPKQLYNRLKYAETINVPIGVGGTGNYLYSCNGMFDPNITGIGHQPMYFDQFTAMYDHYTVLKSMMKATVVANTTGATIFSLGQDDDTTISAANSYTIWERTGYQTKVVNAPVEPSNTYLWSKWDAKKVFGCDPQSDPSMQGSATSNPTEQTYYNIYFDATPSTYVTVLVEIWYDVVWDEYISMVSS